MRIVATALLACIGTLPPAAFAQGPYTEAAAVQFAAIKGFLSKTAARIPEELYSFRPSPDVRTVAQQLGHVADVNFMMCAAANGESQPPQGGFSEKTVKADLVKGLEDSFAYCERVVGALDDARGAAAAPTFTPPMARLSVFYFNIAHANEHYGNLVTYMRLKGIVPPSSPK